ncbi:MAG: hypothetical protein ACE5H2_05955 [Terriglobia bacterium]
MSTTPTAMPPKTPAPTAPLRRVARTIRGLLLWRHERGSWQYDMMVVLILTFVLLSPPTWFHDKIRVLRETPEATQYRIPASLLWQYGEQPEAAAHELLTQRHGKPFTITSIEPVEDDAGAIVWYDVWARPRD